VRLLALSPSTRSYSLKQISKKRLQRFAQMLPRESIELRKKVPPPFVYSDGVHGVIDVFPSGSFYFPVKLYKEEPGIYTVLAWIRKEGTNKTFAATEICIRAE
jgi:hypothetical protein